MLTAENQLAPSIHVPEHGPLAVHTCRTWDELEAFREPWNSMLGANPAASIFQTPEWQAAWWKAFGRDNRLLALVFSDAYGNTVGLAPLYTQRIRFLGMGLTTLRIVGAGSGDSDALDFITAPGHEAACAEAFFAWFARQKDLHICALETLPQKSRIAKVLFRWAQESGWSVDSMLTPNFIVDLPATWPQYLSSLEPSFRPLLTRYPKRLKSRFSVRFNRCERVDDLKAQLQALFDLHQMRWTCRGQTGAFAREDRRDFYFGMAAAFLERGWLEFWQLELDGETVGAQFCFRYNNTVSLLQEGFHPKYAAEKIGYALRAHLLEEMIRAGATQYDFLGGADQYKARFGARQTNYLNLFIAGTSRRARLYLAWQKQERKIKAWLKTNLPADLVNAMRRYATESPGPSQQKCSTE
jgi:CelD/BcsL family acetyltransferase involved in cellulose biosynthesis